MNTTIKEQFKALDLNKQLNNNLKEKWYYKNIKWGLKINKKSVIFDNDFKFKVNLFDDDLVVVKLYINDREDDTICAFYEFEEDPSCNLNYILESILLYISNYI